ncbi:MAG TPA: NADH-quinone oxidoreductase subunit NuoG [Candidatus Hydrogenedentes bacterium]|nr:NADH-quinone oxidoreductase subunit NuoG [Candidatus Hydrogenedentota bacterium]
MATIYIENKAHEVKDGQNLLQACLSLGYDIPYFCWHPALHSVGACRQCAVKQFLNEKDTHGKIVMACMTPVTDGMRISINDPEARAFRKNVVEWLMTNHPHDCPVCDEGGECHLQDMTVMAGHDYRRFRFAKRTHNNQDLGPFIHHEMNRCIQCYRCVRFYRDYAGGRDFNVFGSHDRVYFGRYEEGALENEFSGNLVEVCPTGVFTDKVFKQHHTRPWDLQCAPSVCVHCAVGCNTTPGERYGTLRRIRNRYHGHINGYFLCDRGRYGFDFVNAESRIRKPRIGGTEVSARQALDRLREIMADPETRAVGIGSPRASVESNAALRVLVGPENFYSGMGSRELGLVREIVNILRGGHGRIASLRDIEESDAAFVLGEDVTQTAPRAALALRQLSRRQPMRASDKLGIPRWNDAAVREVVQDAKGPLFIATPFKTKLDDAAREAHRAAPEDIARLGFDVARAIASGGADESPAGRIAHAMLHAEHPVVCSGSGCGSMEILHASANIARALRQAGKDVSLALFPLECNDMGAAMMDGGAIETAAERIRDGSANTVVILENDPYRRATRDVVDGMLGGAKHVIVLDHTTHEAAARAELVLPAAAFAESHGIFVNHEGRAQRFMRVFAPGEDIRDSWRWLCDAASALGRIAPEDAACLDAFHAHIEKSMSAFVGILDTAPLAGARFKGMRIPRESHRYSGRTSMNAHLAVSEKQPPDDPDSPLSHSMEGYTGPVPPSAFALPWAPGWNSAQSYNKFQDEVGGEMHGGDPGVRLIKPADSAPEAFADTVAPFKPEKGRWRIIPVRRLFGSDELGALSPAIASRTHAPCLMLNEKDAAAIGGRASVRIGGISGAYDVAVDASLPDGVAGLCVGWPGQNVLPLPAWAEIEAGGDLS